MDTRIAAECRVWGPLGWALRVSQAAGLAPLRFHALRSGWRVRESPALDVYSKILSVTICLLAAAGMYMDLFVNPHRLLRSSTIIVHFLDFTVITFVVLAASFTGTRRMNSIIACITRLQKINSELNVYLRSSNSKRNNWLLTLLLAWGFLTTTLEFGLLMKNVYYEHGTVISSTSIIFNVLHATQLMVQIQFTLIALTVLETLRKINDCLNNLLNKIRLDALLVRGPILKTSENQLNLGKFHVPVTLINSIIDSLATMDRIKIVAAAGSPQRVLASARLLASAHVSASGAVRRLNRSHGPVLLAVMVFYLVHMLDFGYVWVSGFRSQWMPVDAEDRDEIDSELLTYNPGMQALEAVFHVITFLNIIEPAHQTQQETGRTKNLVSQMLQSTAPRDTELVAELELLLRQVSLNQVAYTPMNMCTLNREIIATMLGTITTYLVVAIQFR